MERQIVVREGGPFGAEEIYAPAGWVFDKGAIEVWYWLLSVGRTKVLKRQRDKFIAEAKIEVLAQVLANALGMATPYWVLAAREFADATT